ncbi:MAG: hypothetical protein PHI85_05115 [Victivallaceae bacterium]|nr:hypothetical protein [Victivallaceae bacterium]
MSIRVNVAIKYDVEFDELGGYSADDAVRMIRKIQSEYAEDVISWVDEHETDFELSRPELQHLMDSGKLLDDSEADELEVFVQSLLDMGDRDKDFIVIQLY